MLDKEWETTARKRRKRARITVERSMACNRGQRQKGVADPPQLHSRKCHSLMTGNKLLGKLASSLAVHIALHCHILLESC